jgi:hypothetical protein
MGSEPELGFWFPISFMTTAIDSPQIGHPPAPDRPLASKTCSVSGKEFGCKTARNNSLLLGFVQLKGVRFEDCQLYINVGDHSVPPPPLSPLYPTFEQNLALDHAYIQYTPL